MRDAVAQAQYFPQEVDARHFRHLLRAIHQVAQREVGTEPELVREPRQAVFHGAEKRVVGTQVLGAGDRALARPAAERLDDRLATGLKDGPEQRVVDARVAAVRRLDGLDVHPGDYYRHGFGPDGGGFRLAAEAEGRRGREARPAERSNEYRRQAWRLRARQAECWRLHRHLERP